MSDFDANTTLSAQADAVTAERLRWSEVLAGPPEAEQDIKTVPAGDVLAAVLVAVVVLAIVGISACLIARLNVHLPF